MTLPSALLTEARKAVPPLGESGKWAPLMPAVEILLGRGFSLADAMDWLVARSVVQPHERRTAYYSVSQRLRRAGPAAPVSPPKNRPSKNRSSRRPLNRPIVP